MSVNAYGMADPGLKPSPPGFPRGYRVTCCRCGYWTDVSASNPSGMLPDEVIRRKVRQRGWEPGKDFSRTLCAKCVEAETKRRPRPVAAPDLTLVPKPAIVQDPAPMSIPHASPVPTDLSVVRPAVRPMSKADRQCIFNKLQDVYPREDAGYLDGWTDERVAQDLGASPSWVALIREENFGPAGKPVDELFAAYRKQTEMELLGLRDRVAELQGDVNRVSAIAADMATLVKAAVGRVAPKGKVS